MTRGDGWTSNIHGEIFDFIFGFERASGSRQCMCLCQNRFYLYKQLYSVRMSVLYKYVYLTRMGFSRVYDTSAARTHATEQSVRRHRKKFDFIAEASCGCGGIDWRAGSVMWPHKHTHARVMRWYAWAVNCDWINRAWKIDLFFFHSAL